MSAKALNDEDSIPLLVHQGERYRDHDHDDDGDERIRSRRGGTEILNSPPPYLKLDPSHVVVGRRQRVWQTRLIRATLVASILAVGIATGLLLEEVGHLKIVQHAVNDVSLSRDGSVETVDAGKGYNNLSRWVKGPAANTFRENLQPDVKYLTTWNIAGMTNNVMGYVNLIYLSLITERVAVIAPLVPSTLHLGKDQVIPFMSFGNMFDLPRLRESIRHPVLDWKDVKRAMYDEPWSRASPPLEGVVKEELGCWSVRTPFQRDLERLLDLDVAYTLIPDEVKLSTPHAWQHSFWGMASLLYTKGRNWALSRPVGSPGKTFHSKTIVPPDEQLACIDDMYAVGSWYEYEWESELSPAWRFVGRHLRYTKEVDRVADAYVRRALGVEDASQPSPKYIGVHIRRDDWDQTCFTKYPDRECFAPLSEFAKGIAKVQQELKLKHSAPPQGDDGTPSGDLPVIVTSDEKNQTWYQGVTDMGWLYVDHRKEDTVARLGSWWPALIDAAVLSRATGFVGLHRSTMSLVAALRVRDWNDGPTRLLQWYDGHSRRRRGWEQSHLALEGEFAYGFD